MKVLVIGANGFVGRGVSEALQPDFDVVKASRNTPSDVNIELDDPQSIADALQTVRPDAVVNCAGIVENNEKAAGNPRFTGNLLQQIVASNLPIKRVIIMGSAGEYGPVENLPVNEDTPRRATSQYGLSKIEEVDAALRFGEEHHLSVVVARLFNPIGSGMAPRMLIPGVLRQIAKIEAGDATKIEVNRLDAKRDYVAVSDVGRAIGCLLGEKPPKHTVYNVGSGKSTTNQELIDLILDESGLPKRPELVETADQPEQQMAVQADISRIQDEFGWQPEVSVADVVKDVMYDKAN